MHQRGVPARPAPWRRCVRAALEQSCHQCRMILMNRFIQTRLRDPGLAIDHPKSSIDVAAMADPRHLVFQVSLGRGWRLAPGRPRRGPAPRRRFEKRNDLNEPAITRASEWRIITNLISKPPRPPLGEGVAPCLQEQAHKATATA